MLNCQVPVELESSAGTFAIWRAHETILRRLHGHLEGDTRRQYRHDFVRPAPYIPIAKTRGFTAQYDKTAISRIKEAQDNGKQGDQKKQPDHD